LALDLLGTAQGTTSSWIKGGRNLLENVHTGEEVAASTKRSAQRGGTLVDLSEESISARDRGGERKSTLLEYSFLPLGESAPDHANEGGGKDLMDEKV